jgi:hypothetical protein
MGGAYDERLLGGGPGEETSLPRRDQVRIFIGRVESFSGIGLEVKDLCTGKLSFATLDWIVMKFTQSGKRADHVGAGFFLGIEQAGSLEINPSP